MTPVEDVLARFRHRYIIIGSGALRLHGIDWEEGDLDIWLDPNLSDKDWQAAVDDAAGSLKRPWRQQYRMVDGRPMPFDSEPRAAWNICLQRTCTQLYKRCLWKCPALAYHAIMSRKLNLDQELAWKLFHDYQACPPTAADEEVRDFLATKEIPQCSLCPARRIPFYHPIPVANH